MVQTVAIIEMIKNNKIAYQKYIAWRKCRTHIAYKQNYEQEIYCLEKMQNAYRILKKIQTRNILHGENPERISHINKITNKKYIGWKKCRERISHISETICWLLTNSVLSI